jgi:hypothetical protein
MTCWQIDGNSVLLFEEEGVKGKQRTGRLTEDGDAASAQIVGLRGVPWQGMCSR